MNLVVEAGSRSNNETVNRAELSPGDPFVHMHIPKTAGTSMRRIYESEFGSENVLIYSQETERLMQAGDRRLTIPNRHVATYERARRLVHHLGLSRLVSASIAKVRAHEAVVAGHDPSDTGKLDFKAIIGHFNSDAAHATELDEYPMVTVVREPLGRAISFYNHWQRTNGDAFGPYFDKPAADETAFEDVALNENQQNFQTRWIGDVELARVGVVEKLTGFLGSLGIERLGSPLRANQNPSKAEPPRLDSGFVRDFTELNAQDYELYYRTLDAWS